MINVRTLIALSVTFAVVIAAPVAMAEDLAGFWKHADEPGWIEITVEEEVGRAVVVRNDVYPERVGRQILKDLRADDKHDGLWRGQVYADRLGEYKDAEISSREPGQMEIKVKVGFISRTVDWVRVESVPAEE